jgi:glucose-like phosphotransferase system IIB component
MEIHELALGYIEALGQAENIDFIEGCITRLRGTLVDSQKVNARKLRQLGAVGRPMIMGKGIQVVVGTYAELIGSEMNKIMRGEA